MWVLLCLLLGWMLVSNLIRRGSGKIVVRREPVSGGNPPLTTSSPEPVPQTAKESLRQQFELLQKERDAVKIEGEKQSLELTRQNALAAVEKAKTSQAAEDASRKMNDFILRNSTEQ